MEKSGGGAVNGAARSAPTGCYKCGLPGHWSRDCPSSSTTTDHNNLTTANGGSYPRTTPYQPVKSGLSSKPKKVPISRPKLTPDLLLSDDGFGHILRHFPRGFKFRGRGHEVDDLRHLLRMYSDWHSRLIPYYQFDQFVHKVEQVCATKRVKVCIRQLRDKVANGQDATMIDEPQAQPENSTHEHDDAMEDLEQPNLSYENNNTLPNLDSVEALDEMLLHQVSESATEVPSSEVFQQLKFNETIATGANTTTAATTNNNGNSNQLSAEQQARMEASRLKALERAAARAKS